MGITNINLEKTPRILVAGGSHTCALLEDKSVECWGSGRQATAPSLNNVESPCGGGFSHLCALRGQER